MYVKRNPNTNSYSNPNLNPNPFPNPDPNPNPKSLKIVTPPKTWLKWSFLFEVRKNCVQQLKQWAVVDNLVTHYIWVIDNKLLWNVKHVVCGSDHLSEIILINLVLYPSPAFSCIFIIHFPIACSIFSINCTGIAGP